MNKTLLFKTQLKFLSFGLLIATIIACNATTIKEKEIALKQKELELNQKELELQESAMQYKNTDKNIASPVEQQSEVKYMYVVINTDEPTITYKKSEILSDGPINLYPKANYFTYVSSIIQVYNFSEDKKFMEIDKFEQEVNPKLEEVNRRLEFKTQGKDFDSEARVVSRKSYVFDSYAEASIQRTKENSK